jgi:multidrug transporter EmrE-like cation transporter
VAPQTKQHTSGGSVALVVFCTVIGAAAQILMRQGAAQLTGSSALGLLSNWPLLGGYLCLALNTGLLVLALRNGHLSVLYPIIALTYVWVTILSPLFFHDVVNSYKVTGVALIVLGVSFIGFGSRA